MTLDTPSGQTVFVDYSTADDTATQPDDYAAVPATQLVFAPGQTSQTATVIVNGDSLDEIDETFSVDLSGELSATLGDAQAVGTITDDDGPAISIDNVSVTEGDTGTVTADFDLSLDASSPQEVTVEYETIDDTATAGEDYVAADATADFAPGETEQLLSITVNGDTADELDESFFIALSGSENGSVATELAQGTILNDDTPPTVSIGDVTVAEGDSGATNGDLHRQPGFDPSAQTVTVDYASSRGNRDRPRGLRRGERPAQLRAGRLSETITVPVAGDLLDEDHENYTIALSSSDQCDARRPLGLGTITDDDAAPAISRQRRVGDRRQQRHHRRDLHRHARPRRRPRLSARVRDRERTPRRGADYVSQAASSTSPPGKSRKRSRCR